MSEPTDTAALDWLTVAARRRAAAGLHRTLVSRPDLADRGVLDLASNDYLGLSGDPRVIEAALDATRVWGTGSTGSRLVTGTTALHEVLEQGLAELVGAPAALVFSSGYLANVGLITALAGPDCLVVSDAGNHASLVDGCRLAKSSVMIAAHGDLPAVEQALAARSVPRALVVVDAINSADGDLMPLLEWHRVARRYGALLLVDDAHGVGIRGGGRGSVAEAGIAAEPDVITTVTLSKSLAAQGGAVLGDRRVIDHLIDTARAFIFDTGLAPAAAGAALEAVRIIGSEPALAAAVLDRAARLAAVAPPGAQIPAVDGAIVPIIVGDAATAYGMAQAMRDKGVHVGCFRPPSVPAGTARLRVTARSNLTADDIDQFAQVLATVWAP